MRNGTPLGNRCVQSHTLKSPKQGYVATGAALALGVPFYLRRKWRVTDKLTVLQEPFRLEVSEPPKRR